MLEKKQIEQNWWIL